MSGREVIANFWVECERATGTVPCSVVLPPKAFDALAAEFGDAAVSAVLSASMLGHGMPVLVLLHRGGQKMTIARAVPPAAAPTADRGLPS